MTDAASLRSGQVDLWQLPWFETLLALGTFITLLSYSQKYANLYYLGCYLSFLLYSSPYQMNFIANVVLFGLLFYSNFIPFFGTYNSFILTHQ